MKIVKIPKKNFFIASLLILLAVIYYPIFGTYAHTDAYEFFWNAKRNPIFHHVFIQGGRPIFGFFITELFQWTDSIADLKYIRLVAFVGNTILLLTFYQWLVRTGYPKKIAVPLTLFFACSSFMCLAMSWTATFQIGWAMLAGLFSAVLCARAIDENSDSSILSLASVVCLGIISLMLYQSSFTLFALVIFLIFDQKRQVGHYVKAISVYLIIFVLYYFIFKLILWYTGLPPIGRSDINLDIVNKLAWFFDDALVHSLTFNLRIVRNSFVNLLRVPVALLFLFCIVQYYSRNGLNRRTITYGLIVASVYFLAYIPNLVSVENHASNRSLGTVVLLNAYFLYKMILHLIESEKLQQVVIVFVTSGFCVFGYTTLRYGVTNIQTAEYTILKNATREILVNDTTHSMRVINIIRPSRYFLQEQGIVQRESGGEFGLLSNSVEWATLPMFESIIEEISRETGNAQTTIHFNICDALTNERCLNEGPFINCGEQFLTDYGAYY